VSRTPEFESIICHHQRLYIMYTYIMLCALAAVYVYISVYINIIIWPRLDVAAE